MRVAMALLVTLLPTLAHAQEPPSLAARFGATGILERLDVDGARGLDDLALSIISPGWGGDLARQGQLTEVTLAEEGAIRHVSGVLPVEGKPVRFSAEVEGVDGALHFRVRLEATASVEAEGVFVRANLPVEGFAGSEWWLAGDAGTRGGALPRELPESYVLTSGRYAWLAWRDASGGAGVKLTPTVGIASIQLQDDRKFGYPHFELQLVAEGARRLEPGQPIELAWTLEAVPAEQFAAWQAEEEARLERERVVFESREPLTLGSVVLPAGQPEQWRLLEIPLPLSGTWDNPFDPEEIEVIATFRHDDGRAWSIPAFWYVPYERQDPSMAEPLVKTGPPEWVVRFAPVAPGWHELTVRARDRSGEVVCEPLRFLAQRATTDGGIRRANGSRWYLETQSGKPWFAIGENVCWAGGSGLGDYERWLPRLAAAGGNYARIWLVRWNMGFEWSADDPSSRGRFYGLGRYSPDNGARLDGLLSLAEREGIRLMLCLGYHGELLDQQAYFGEQRWERSPYNAANGGPCAKPADFWTDETARTLYKQKLRYAVSRWGWSASVLSFEFWNEVNAPAAWIDQMARYVRSIDPYGRLLTTTYGDDAVWSLPDMDYSQTHWYGVGDVSDPTPVVSDHARTHTSKFGKPYMLGEFGIDWRSSDLDYDPGGRGTSLHDGLWSAMAQRSMGSAMVWYWDNYVDPLDLYHTFTGLSRFAAEVPWNTFDCELARFAPPTRPVEAGEPWRATTVVPTMGWGRSTGSDFQVEPTGKLTGDGAFSSFLYSPGKPAERTPLRFAVETPNGGTVALHLREVCTRARLRALVDGVIAWERDFLAGDEGEGEWTTHRWRDDFGIWIAQYDRNYEFALEPGSHTIEFEVVEGDWCDIASYRFEGCVDPRYDTALEALGVRDEQLALVWIHNTRSNWQTDRSGAEPEPTDSHIACELLEMPEGTWRIEWWATRAGEIVRTEELVARDGRLRLEPGAVARDVACKIVRVR